MVSQRERARRERARRGARAAPAAVDIPLPAELTEAEILARRTVTLRGQDFVMSESIAIMAFMHLAHLGEAGVDSSEMDGLAALYAVCRGCFTEESWDRYRVMATELRLDDEQILADVQELVTVVSSRPISRRSDSSAGPSGTRSGSPRELEPSAPGEVVWQGPALPSGMVPLASWGPPVTPELDPEDRTEVEEVWWALDRYGPSEEFPDGRPDLQAMVVQRWEATHGGAPLPLRPTG